MNHRFTLDMAAAFAQRVERESGDTAAQVERVFVLAYTRPPDDDERTAAIELVRQHGLRALCRAVLNSNEMIYIR